MGTAIVSSSDNDVSSPEPADWLPTKAGVVQPIGLSAQGGLAVADPKKLASHCATNKLPKRVEALQEVQKIRSLSMARTTVVLRRRDSIASSS